MTIIRKLQNISEVDVPIQTNENTTIFIHPGQSMQNIEMSNLENVKKYLKVEQDLAEINPIKESKVKLYD